MSYFKNVDNYLQERSVRFNKIKTQISSQNSSLYQDILALSLFDLIEYLQSGKYSAINVLYAYLWKALQINERLNCVCDFLIESFDTARELDKKAANGVKKLPLHGVPFSVKENFFLEGHYSCIGLAKNFQSVKTETCTLVTQLKNLGAVPFVVTNVPQTLLSFVCSNPIFGLTKNPHNLERTPGGSSGGEACLLSAGGTPFAIGSDLAGSLRIPANFCGVYTLKPTQDRFIVENAYGGIPGRCRFGLSYGFFTHSVKEQNFLLNLVLGTNDYKNLIVRNAASNPFKKQDFDQIEKKSKLRIGYFVNDGFLKPVPACAKVVEETVEKLITEGHDLVKFILPNPTLAAKCFFKGAMPDGGKFWINYLKHDKVDKYLKDFAFALKLPYFLRSLLAFIIGFFSPQLKIMLQSYVVTAEDVIKTNSDIDKFNKEFVNYWKDLKIDALICPAFKVPAIPHKFVSKLSACAISVALFNIIDCPAGIVPTRKVTDEDDYDLLNEKKWPTNKNILLKIMRNASKNSKNLPLSVQIVTLPFEEEKCLGVMKLVENLWQYKKL